MRLHTGAASAHSHTRDGNRTLPYLLCALFLLPLGSDAVALNVDDFGARGDGRTWDHVAIQAAINAAGTGGLVEFTAGRTYVQCAQITPLPRQTLRGNQATLKRCDPPVARLITDVEVGAIVLAVDDASAFTLNQSITPVKAAGGYPDGEFVLNHFIRAINGNELTFNLGLSQSYPAGSLVTVKFDQIYVFNSSTHVTIDGLIFDGNRARNDIYVTWTDNKAIRGFSGLIVRNCRFADLPGNGIMLYGTDVLVDGNRFQDLDGPAIHLSNNVPTNGSVVTISNNLIERTNRQAERMQHSEGVITISAFNDSINVSGNTVIDAAVPFISRFHADMRDWLVRDNTVYGTKGAFFGRVWPGEPLANVVFEDNSFFNVGESRTIRTEGAAPIDGFVFRRNRVIGGNLRFDGLANGSIDDNTVKACGVAPVMVTGGSNVTIAGNVTENAYCLLSIEAMPLPGTATAPAADVVYTVSVENTADAGDVVASAGVTVDSIIDSTSGMNIGGLCSPTLPAQLALGQILTCSMLARVSGQHGNTIARVFSARGRLQNGSAVTYGATARVRITDIAPPVISLSGPDPQIIEAGGAYAEQGAIARDDFDGDISRWIVIANPDAIETRSPGTFHVSYEVSDSAENAATTRTRTVRIVDSVPPVITLAGGMLVTIPLGASYVEPGATARDNVDGDVSADIHIDANTLNISQPGRYFVIYRVEDLSGNAVEMVRTVVVQAPPSGGGALGGSWLAELLTLLLLRIGAAILRRESNKRSRIPSCLVIISA